MAVQTHWTKKTHPAYENTIGKWKSAEVHYSGDFDKLRTDEYLIQREQGESDKQHEERKKRSDYLPLFGTVVDAAVGREMSVEPPVGLDQEERGEGDGYLQRQWSDPEAEDGLGDPAESETKAGKLWEDADGNGKNYLTIIQQAAVELVKKHEVWCLVEGITRDPAGNAVGEASIRMIEPEAVTNWRSENGRLSEVVIKHQRDTRTSIKDDPKKSIQEMRRVYDLEGYQDYAKNDEDEMAPVSEHQPYGSADNPDFQYYRTENRNRSILPIFRVSLPLKRNVGYIWAEKNGVIFNKESERDNLLTVANTPLLQLAATKEQYDNQIKEPMEDGQRVLLVDPDSSQGHEFKSPPVDSARIATEVLEQKVEHYFISAFRSFENAVRAGNRTATEVEHDAQMGEETFLGTLAIALDELEKHIGWLLYQIYFPRRPELWGQFTIERPKRKFSRLDEKSLAEKLKAQFFPDRAVPIGQDGLEQAARKIAQGYGINPDEAQVSEAVNIMLEESNIEVERKRQALQADRQRMDGMIENRRRAIEQAANNGE